MMFDCNEIVAYVARANLQVGLLLGILLGIGVTTIIQTIRAYAS